jgi:hypothetical protein
VNHSHAPVVPSYPVTPPAEENSTTPSNTALRVPGNDSPSSGRTTYSVPVARSILRSAVTGAEPTNPLADSATYSEPPSVRQACATGPVGRCQRMCPVALS